MLKKRTHVGTAVKYKLIYGLGTVEHPCYTKAPRSASSGWQHLRVSPNTRCCYAHALIPAGHACAYWMRQSQDVFAASLTGR